MERLDPWFDFTSDTPGFWDGFWENRNGLGMSGADPDMKSPMLRRFHKVRAVMLLFHVTSSLKEINTLKQQNLLMVQLMRMNLKVGTVVKVCR